MIEDLHLKTIKNLPADEPVLMVNLMKFRDRSLDGDGSGWDAYVRYSQMANKLIKERSGRIVWAAEIRGTTLGPEVHGQWDYLALVSYPGPAVFLDMMTSDAYKEADVHRTNGCESHMIMAANESFNGFGR